MWTFKLQDKHTFCSPEYCTLFCLTVSVLVSITEMCVRIGSDVFILVQHFHTCTDIDRKLRVAVIGPPLCAGHDAMPLKICKVRNTNPHLLFWAKYQSRLSEASMRLKLFFFFFRSHGFISTTFSLCVCHVSEVWVILPDSQSYKTLTIKLHTTALTKAFSDCWSLILVLTQL